MLEANLVCLFLYTVLAYESNTSTSSSSVTGTSSQSQTGSASPSMSELFSLTSNALTPYITPNITVNENTSNGLKGGEIFGIAIGTTAGVLIFAINIYLLKRYLNKRRR